MTVSFEMNSHPYPTNQRGMKMGVDVYGL